MKKTLVLCLVVVFAVTSLAAVANAKKVTRQSVQFESTPRPDAPLPPDLIRQLGGMRSAAQADTFVLLEEDFDLGPPISINYPGWSKVDRTDQFAAFFHVAGSELNGGTFGNLLPLSGAQSMWCGVSPSTAVPFCGYSNLPGYGDGWDQILESTMTTGDSLSLDYNIFWDSEGGYDGTAVEYTFDGGSTWFQFAITDTLSARALLYDNTGITPFMSEGPFTVGGPAGVNNAGVRFRFVSDGAWSDEDGLWPTDGGVILDDITYEVWNGGISGGADVENFEGATEGSNTAGIWSGVGAPAFGAFAALYPGVSVVQEDPCFFVPLFLWGYFEDPINNPYLCHEPNPLPGQGAMPFGTPDGIYMSDEVWSPPVANIVTVPSIVSGSYRIEI